MVNLDKLLIDKEPKRISTNIYATTDTSPFSKLDVECLEKILGYFSNDNQTLFNCILVNRLWCHIAIPLLWSNPFEFLKFQKYEHGWQLIRTYLTCLPDDEKQTVNKWILPSDLQKPLFDYPKYLKCLDTFGFQEA